MTEGKCHRMDKGRENSLIPTPTGFGAKLSSKIFHRKDSGKPTFLSSPPASRAGHDRENTHHGS